MGIEVRRLRKSYGAVPAVRDVSFDVESGTVFAFLGPNGAGKSTTISCITTVLAPDSGEILVDGARVGRDDAAIRRRIGVVFQGSLLDDLLSVRENLETRARFYGLTREAARRRVGELSELIQLGTFLDRRYGTLSGGQRRRADIARALVHDPAVLFLDEPTTGLDPQSREQVWDAVHALREQQGTTVFLTTHYMAETEEAADVCIIDAGRIVAQGSPTELRRQHSSSVLTLTVADPGRLAAAADPMGLAATADGDRWRVPVSSATQAREVMDALGDALVDFEFRHGTMDDVFLALTETAPEP
ncbi:ATP-binding cassette domain-containing protein [Pseudolysinimonas sp.]|uniref:ABC transporter ATP-binding protein n=1 Tax=Pseudolysinimonas sp. TaxID=2680009 RepID=UPI003F7F9473